MKTKRATGGDAGLGKGHDYELMWICHHGAPRSRAASIWFFQALDGIEERKDHDQQIGVAKARIERDVRTKEINWIGNNAEIKQRRIDEPRGAENDH